MKKTTMWPTSMLRIGMLISVLLLSFFRANGQCSCSSNPDVNPGDPNYYHYIALGYDTKGFVTNYSFVFQFPCMGEPLDEFDYYTYGIIYREKGTTEWSIEQGGGDIFQGANLHIVANALEPCKTYELRVTCPECIPDPNSLYCGSEIQLQRYFNDENNTLHNVSRIWEVCYAPIENKPINNFKVSGIDPISGSVNVSWDHLPGEATYTIEYRKKPSSAWLLLGTTDIYKFIINNLEACAEYDVRVRGSVDNCCGGTKYSQPATLSFVMTGCMSTITNVDEVTGNSAHVSWEFLGSDPAPLEYEVQWWKSAFNVMTATVTSTDYTITGLDPNSNYNVKIITKCGPQTCSGYSQVVKFHTSCELHEPNNNFQTATPISFNSDIENSNIMPVGDVDFFKFTPTTCFIEVLTDHPDLDSYPNPDPDYWSPIDLPYVLYDQNFQEIPRTAPYEDAQSRLHYTTHMVTAGQEYYIAIKWWDPSKANLNCYSFKVYPCTECDFLANLQIYGTDKVYTVPATANYGLGAYYSPVDWTVDGPADLIQDPSTATCDLNFYDVGTVILTANVRRCDGTSVSAQKEIVVSDECNIVGTYSNGHQGNYLYEGLMFMESSNYTITLDLPVGISFYVYSYGGDASWVIDGNKIIVTQIGSVASLRIVLSGGNCTSIDGIYTFIKWPNGPVKPPIEWTISPNPTSSTLQITPAISPEVDLGSVPEWVDIRLFNQNAYLTLSQSGSTRTPTSLNMANLVPGNYTLQLLYGEYWQQFTVVKQ
ncbi:MAG: fibronectin type III domain-containing protein [Phycisphaerae bacterium]|nr:fibronectin type III domain-containing protein [Saprospiraceae bacterium]